MKKLSIFLGLALILIVGMATGAKADTPTLKGTYIGNATKITDSGCSSVSVKVVIAKQCATLFNGSVTMGGKSVKFVGRIEADKSIYIHGYYFSGTNYGYVTLVGNYVTSPKVGIKVKAYAFEYNSTLPENCEYNIFTVNKQ